MINYSNFSHEDIYQTSFSQLLSYPEFTNAKVLANGLALFENPNAIRYLLRDCMKNNDLKFWIGQDLAEPILLGDQCAVIAIPYHINQTVVGAIGLLGPMRIEYKKIFPILRHLSEVISKTLTDNLYKFKITFRQPAFFGEGDSFLEMKEPILLEDKSSKWEEN